jgi:hypothetical protein
MATDKIQIGLRVPEDLRLKIQEAAGTRGVAVNKEISDRLERSFQEKRHWESFDNPAANGIVAVLAQAIYAAAHNANNLSGAAPAGWHNDPRAFGQVCSAVSSIMNELRPAGKAEYDGSHADFFNRVGVIVAEGILSEIAQVDEDSKTMQPERIQRARQLKEGLGEMAQRLEEKFK